MSYLFHVLVYALFASLGHCKCYYPDRAEAVLDEPCVDGKASACCAPNATCLSNGACFSGGVLSRGACTDIDWLDPACFPRCQQKNTNGGVAVVSCHGNPSVDWTFACGVGNCNNTDMTFTLKHEDMDAYALILRPSQISSVISSASASAATLTSGQNGSSAGGGIVSAKSFTAGEMAGVGVGIGLPLTAIICILSWLLIRAQRKSRDLEVNMTQEMDTIEKAALDRSEYTIGWITVKPESELVAARLMLDEAHTKIGVHGDSNIYYPGRIGKHNVIICCSGEAGQHQAAECAINMIRTFTNIKLGLLSGIGGGVPSPKHDIRLGDVVVGMPDGVYGGVTVYNSGKMTHEGYELRFHLNCSPRVIRNTVGELQAEIEMGRDGITANLDRVAIPQYKSCETVVDQFFEDDELQDRVERPTTGPVVHHGLIACGDWVVKDGVGRNDLVKRVQGDVLCFEMEAAGLMNAFPCLVVRGISDYCDRHKNDGWHRYASATAAAYCKWVLQELSPNAVGAAETAASLTDVHRLEP